MATVLTNFANAFETTLTADMLGTDLTAQVQTTDGAPTSPCYLVIDPHNDDKREYALFDGTFTANSFVTTALANRYLDGSAAASGITHAAGAIVRFSPVAQHFTDLRAAVSEDVIHADRYDTLQDALNAAAAGATGVVRRVLAPNTYNITTTLLIDDNTILDGAGTGRIVKNSTSSFKMLTNADATAGTVNTGIHVRDITLVGTPLDGTEQNAGIHFSLTTDSSIIDVIIENVRGDGITLGNITADTIQTCERVTVERCKITNANRQGIALTDARSCRVANNFVENCTNTGVGIGIDLEPNFAGQYILENHVAGNTIEDCNHGIFGVSAANLTGTNMGNHVVENTVVRPNNVGVKWAYDFATVSLNIIREAGTYGIYVVSSASQLQGVVVTDNAILDAGQLADNTYAGIEAENVIHSVFSGNLFYSTLTNKISKLWNETGTSGYNSWVGNNGRQVAKAYTVVSTSNASHNLLNISAITNRHEGFVATGQVVLPSGTASASPLRIPHGSAPTTPTNGDVWTTTAGLYVYTNGVTVGPIVSKSRLWVPAALLNIATGTPSLSTSPGGRWVAWFLDAAATEGVSATVLGEQIAGWSTYNVIAVISNVATGTGDYNIRPVTETVASGGTFGNGTVGTTVTTTAAAQHVRQEVTLRSGVAAPAADSVEMIRVDRTGGDAADTLPNDIALHGLILLKTS